MPTESKPAVHTATPWHVFVGGNFVKVAPEGYDQRIHDEHYLGGAICHMDTWTGDDHDSKAPHVEANARLIVRSVNAHEASVEALRQAKAFITAGDEYKSGHTGAASVVESIARALALAEEQK